jgi:hypothetical protein
LIRGSRKINEVRESGPGERFGKQKGGGSPPPFATGDADSG